jgi:hypothetical protein
MTFVPPRVPLHLHGKVSKLVGDLDLFARLHKVQEKKTKKLIDFDPLPMQVKIFEAVNQGHNRILIVKARQVAATTGAKMVLHQQTYAEENEAMRAIVSMRDDSATALLDDSRRWLTDVPALLRRPIRTQARGRIVYGDTGASLQAFTTRSKDGLRSFTPSAALISEAAFAPDLEEVIAQADAAVGEGLLIVESTANNPADYFSEIVRDAPHNGWHLLTLWWWEHPKYRSDDAEIPDDFEPTEAERKLQQRYGLTRNQLHWRRKKSRNIGMTKFRREYPGCLDDCFLGREGGYFGDELLHQVVVADYGNQTYIEHEAPHPHDKYVVGVDLGGGVGGDYSVLSVVSVATRQPVYVERSNRVTPAQWAHRVIQVASRYNEAQVLAESNNHGHAFLLELNQCGYRHQWLSHKGKPWVTTLQSKLDAFDSLREALQLVRVLDRATYNELRSLTILPGKVAPEAPKGAHDDCAVALALAYRCLRDVPSTFRTAAQSANTRTRIDDLIAASRAKRIRAHSLPF